MALTRIGRYEIQRRLGGGGMGSLYLARDPSLDRLVAIKLLRDDFHDDPDLRERFTREARSVARLRHPNIVIIHDVGEHDGRPFMAMEYVAGETLAHVLRRTPPMPLADRLGLVEDMCAGLAHAHSAGIVHRDIKPANVMLDAEGAVKILDFGIARLTNSGMTQDGMMLGTVNYMSPEQVVGRGVDHRTDIFATGALLYEVIAFAQAFPGGIDTGVLHRILNAGPEPLTSRVPSIDAELAAIVDRALDREPTRRYQDMNLVRRDIARVRRRLLEDGEGSSTLVPQSDRTAIARPKTSPSRGGQQVDSDRPRRLDPQRFAEVRRQQLEEHLRLGEAAYATGDHEAAIHHAERAAAVDPDSRSAYDLIDKARFAIDAKAVRELLADANRLLSEGRLADASGVADQALAAIPDYTEAGPLRDEAQNLARDIAIARDRELRITSSLQRARSSLDAGGYETALRAVYEALALDPDRAEARELEQFAHNRLQAKREQEQARRLAEERLKLAHTLALDNRFDEAVRVIETLAPPSESVRLAAAEALDTVRRLERQAMHAATTAQAQADYAAGHFERAAAAIDSIPETDRTDAAKSLKAAAAEALRQQRELEQKRRALDEKLTAVNSLIDDGDLAKALEGVEAAARIGLHDERIAGLRQRIADLAVAAQEKRRQEIRDRLAERTVDAARGMFARGQQGAAVDLLERDHSGHALVAQTLRELRETIAVQEEAARREAERRRLDEEARAEKRRAEEQRRQQEARRLHEAEQARRRDRMAAIAAGAESALAANDIASAKTLLAQADAVGPIEEGAQLVARLAAAKADVDRREQRRRELEQHLAQARESLARGRVAAARGAVAAALALDAADAEALRVRADIDAEAERLEAEAQRAEQARRQAAEARRREERADELLRRAQHAPDEDALDLLKQALTLVPTHIRVKSHIDERHASIERRRVEEERQRAEAARRHADEERRQAEDERRRVEAREREAAEKAAQGERNRLERERWQREREEQSRREREEQSRREREEQSRREREEQSRREREEQSRREREEQARREHERAEQERRASEEESSRAVHQDATLVVAPSRSAAPASAETASEATVVRPPVVVPPKSWPVKRLAVAAGLVGTLALGTIVFRLAGGDATPPARSGQATPPPTAGASGAPAATPDPEPPPPAPATVDPSSRPGVEPKPEQANGNVEQQLQGHRARARGLLARGLRPQALAALQSALQLKGEDQEARAMLDAMAREADSELERAKTDAAARNAPVLAAETYRAAATLQSDAERERRAGRMERALPLLWASRDRFAGAAEEAARAPRPAPAEPAANQPEPPRPAPQPPVAVRQAPAVEPRPQPPAGENPAPSTESDRAAIVRTLRAYEAAWASLDIDAIRRVHDLSGPELTSVQRGIDVARAYSVAVQIQDISVGSDGRQATVTAMVRRVLTPKGAARTSDITRDTIFSMEKRGDTWIIAGMRIR